MTHLEIDFGSGDRRTVELDKRQPVSIGQHASNDVSISGDDVELMHCRIGWRKPSGYEVVAAGMDGVDVNGTLVQKAMLVAGDTLRIGQANIVFRDDTPAPPETADFAAHRPDSDAYSLKPLSSEIDIPSSGKSSDSPPLTADENIADNPPLTADEILVDDPIDEPPPRRKKKSRSNRTDDRSDSDRKRKQRDREKKPQREDTSNGRDRDHANEPDEDRILSRKSSTNGDEPDSSPDEATSNREAVAAAALRERFRPRPQRPGDRDAARSPFVLTLIGGVVVLLLVGATFYFMLGRQTTQTEFDAAQALMDEGKYAQAITAFEDFLALHPRDSLADQAEVQMWLSRIERQAGGASPDWTKALEELNGFINARRDGEDFEQLHDTIRKRAEAIAEGAATSAGKSYDRALLAVSDDAANLLTIYTSQDVPPTDILKRIESARRVSEASILKHESFTEAVAEMDAALGKQETMAALAARRRLIGRYSEFASDRTIQSKLNETLDVERKLVTRNDAAVDALSDERASDFPLPLTLTFHARSRTDEVSVGSTVFGIAKDSCFAVDSITGEPVWRRAIGWDSPFFPVAVSSDVPALLAFDTNHDELLLLDQKTGQLIWRQPEVRGVTNTPIVDDGQIYAVSSDGTLSKLDLKTGRLLSRLKFSQPVSAPAAFNDGARLIVSGEQEVVYTLTRRPLECVAVTYLGHKPKGIAAPILPMGALLLVAENLPGEKAVLHVLDTRNSNDKLKQVVEHTIPGHVIDPPVIRGRDLFVPSTGERISSFTVTDEEGQPPLTEGPRYEAEGAQRSPVYLATGPDRQVWMASRYLRKLRLTTDAVEPAQQLMNIGIAAQPLQQLGKRIFVGRTLPYSSAVTLFQTDRDQLASQWEAVVGARLLATAVLPDQQGLLAVAESGDVYRVSASRLVDGGFLTSTTVRIKIPEGLEEPLEATTLDDGSILVWCGGPEPQLWIINRIGQVDRNLPLPEALQAAPVRIGSRIALPLSGRIHLLAERGAQSPVQDFTLPQGDDAPPAWRQLISIDDTSLIAVTESGQVRLLRLQDSPQAYLAEAGLLDAGAPIDYRLDVWEGQLGLAAGERLQLIDAATLEPIAETSLKGTLSNDLWFAGGSLFVETDRNSLHCFHLQPELAEAWALPLSQTSLSASPFVTEDGASVVMTLRDGTVKHVAAQTGEVRKSSTVGQTLTSGPQHVDSALVVATNDGSLVRVESILNSE